jgi:glycosyltransferase involved in cell wall biosynthesis
VTGDPPTQTTIVLPAWDKYAGDRLTRALTSLREQPVEAPIIVVDNASRVRLPELSGITVVHAEQRLTLGEARNLGLAAVDTRYVLVWDADDVMLPGTLSFLEDAMTADKRLAATGLAIVEDPSGERHRWPRRWVRLLLRWPPLFAMLDSIWSMYPTTGATIMRTDLVRSAGGYGTAESGEDWCLGVSLAFRGRLGWSERPGRIYRVHEESVWARHMTVAHQLRHAHAVRERILMDPGIPGWVRAALPMIQLGQYTAIAAHAMIAAGRRAGLSRSSTGR